MSRVLNLGHCTNRHQYCSDQITLALRSLMFSSRKPSSPPLSSKQLMMMMTTTTRSKGLNYYGVERTITQSHTTGRLVAAASASSSSQPLDLTEENVEKVLEEAKVELSQLFDNSVGITGQAELADVDGPFVKLRLKGKFWHKRSTVLARLSNYLRQRIPEILEVDIEDEKQLDDSPASF